MRQNVVGCFWSGLRYEYENDENMIESTVGDDANDW